MAMMNFGDFAAGAADSAAGGLRDINRSRLELQMLSKRMEMENNMRQQQMQYAKTLTSIPEDQFKKVIGEATKFGSSIMSGQAPEPVDASSITDPHAQDLFGKLVSGETRMGANMMQTVSRVVNEDGQQFLVSTDKRGNVVKKTNLGMDKVSQNAVRAANARFGSANSLLDALEGRVRAIYSAKNATMLPEQFASMKLEQLIQTDPQVKAFFSQLPADAQRLEKELTGTARVPENLVEAARGSLPTMGDTLPTALQKIQNYRQIFDGTRRSTIDAYRKNPSQIVAEYDIGDPNPRPMAQPQDSPYSPQAIAAEKQRRAMLKSQGGQGAK